MHRYSSYTAVMAGAGTGKTYSLVENYLCSLFGLDGSGIKKRPQEILALTFTQKAANEMRLRIAKRLSDILLVSSADDPLELMASTMGLSMPSHDEVRRVLRALPNAPIATFHGFCVLLLKREARAIGIDDGFTILSPKDELLMARNLLRPLVISEIEKNNTSIKALIARFRLSNSQLSVGLIDAILDLYFKLPEQGMDCRQLKRLNGINKIKTIELNEAAVRIEESLLAFSTTDVTTKTRERLELLRQDLQGLRHSLKCLSEQDVVQSYRQLRERLFGNFGDRKLRSALVQDVLQLGALLVDYFLIEDEQAILRILNTFDDLFMEHKNGMGVLSYQDLLSLTKRSLNDDVDLRRRIKQGISHILIDEYQDTNPIQEDIISFLAEGDEKERSLDLSARVLDMLDFKGGASLFMVGDKKQSIYGFRGADSSLIDRMINKMNLSQDLSSPFQKKLLTMSRRSSRKVIDLINLVAEHTLLEQGYGEDQSLKSMSKAVDGRCALWVMSDDEGLDKTSANLLCASNGIIGLLQSREDLKASDIAVLVRRIKSAWVIRDRLASFGISSQVVGGDGFFQQQEIVDLICALQLMVDPGDPFASSVVLRSPLVLLKDRELLKIACSSEEGLSLLTANGLVESHILEPSSKERLLRFFKALDVAKEHVWDAGLVAALNAIIDGCDYVHACGLSDRAFQKWANIEKLRSLVANRNNNPFTIIDDLYQRIFEQDKEPLARGRICDDAVSIMTIHQSKGLEFKVVVVADGESNMPRNLKDFLISPKFGLTINKKGRAIGQCAPQTPAEKAVAKTRYDNASHCTVSNERLELPRLLYVALSRAKEEVYVASSRSSFEDERRPFTLLGLFLRPYKNEQHRFKQICDVEDIAMAIEGDRKEVAEPAVRDITTLVRKKTNRRLFASSLVASHDGELWWLSKYRPLEPAASLDGEMAHKLLAGACGAISGFKEINDLTLSHILNSIARAMGIHDSSLMVDTMKAVRTTLLVLMRCLSKNDAWFFEMPLISRPLDDLMIEGFADLVVLGGESIGVIEFKSSYHRATHPNTYLQVMAYADALKVHYDKPIRFATMLLGADRDIEWHCFDKLYEDLFLRELKHQEYKN